MEVVAAERAGNVDGLADEVEAGRVSRLHGLRRQLGGIHATDGHFRDSVALGGCGPQDALLQVERKIGEGLVG